MEKLITVILPRGKYKTFCEVSREGEVRAEFTHPPLPYGEGLYMVKGFPTRMLRSPQLAYHS